MLWLFIIALLALVVLWPRRIVMPRPDVHVYVDARPRLPPKPEPPPDLRCRFTHHDPFTRTTRCEVCAGAIASQLYARDMRPYERTCPVLWMKQPADQRHTHFPRG